MKQRERVAWPFRQEESGPVRNWQQRTCRQRWRDLRAEVIAGALGSAALMVMAPFIAAPGAHGDPADVTGEASAHIAQAESLLSSAEALLENAEDFYYAHPYLEYETQEYPVIAQQLAYDISEYKTLLGFSLDISSADETSTSIDNALGTLDRAVEWLTSNDGYLSSAMLSDAIFEFPIGDATANVADAATTSADAYVAGTLGVLIP
jgi:hypothetical protein